MKNISVKRGKMMTFSNKEHEQEMNRKKLIIFMLNCIYLMNFMLSTFLVPD